MGQKEWASTAPAHPPPSASAAVVGPYCSPLGGSPVPPCSVDTAGPIPPVSSECPGLLVAAFHLHISGQALGVGMPLPGLLELWASISSPWAFLSLHVLPCEPGPDESATGACVPHWVDGEWVQRGSALSHDSLEPNVAGGVADVLPVKFRGMLPAQGQCCDCG